MKATWQILANKMEAFNHRERWLVLLAGMVVIYALFNALLVGPVIDKKAAVMGEIAQSQGQVTDLTQQLMVFSQHPVDNPDVQNEQKLAQMKQQIETQNNALVEVSQKLVSPEAMTSLLKNLLQKNAAIHLVGMQTLVPENVLSSKPTAQAAITEQQTNDVKMGLYRHGVQMTIAGNYLDLLQYVAALERLPMQIYMGQSQLQAKVFPQSELTMTLYTLSLDQAWLSI